MFTDGLALCLRLSNRDRILLTRTRQWDRFQLACEEKAFMRTGDFALSRTNPVTESYMPDKWNKTIKDDFQRAHDGSGPQTSDQLGKNDTKHGDLDNPARGPKHPERNQPAPQTARSLAPGGSTAPAPQRTIREQWDFKEQQGRTKSMSKETGGLAEKKGTLKDQWDQAKRKKADKSLSREFNQRTR